MFFFASFVFVTSSLYIVLTWFPSVMIREGYGTASSIGRPLGVVFLAVGLSACFLSQFLVRKLDNSDMLGTLLRRLSIVLAIQIPLIAAFAIVESANTAYWFYACEVATLSVTTTFMASPIQLGVPNRMRGRATGLFLLFNNVLGASLGPAAVGALSDTLKGHPHSLVTAFVTVLGISSVCSVILMYLSSTKRAAVAESGSLQTSCVPRNSQSFQQPKSIQKNL
jgi:hypothetical protein